VSSGVLGKRYSKIQMMGVIGSEPILMEKCRAAALQH
jgi:hypothetical protein